MPDEPSSLRTIPVGQSCSLTSPDGSTVALLFRDYLRTHPERAAAYANVKHRLAPLLLADRHAYVDAKAPFIWETIHLADDWGQSVGWEPGPSDG